MVDVPTEIPFSTRDPTGNIHRTISEGNGKPSFNAQASKWTAQGIKVASELAMILDGIDVSKLQRVLRYERPVRNSG
jgi:hypothetical protein